jgi:hypothetical protein
MAWNGEMRPFVAGVKPAMVAGIILPLLIVTFGFDVHMLGARAAAQHAAFRLRLVVDCTGILAAPRKTAADMQRAPNG